MTTAISAHKKMAMGMTEGNVMKKGGKVKKFAKGGSVTFAGSGTGLPAEITNQKDVNKIGAISEKKVANLPAKGSVKPFDSKTGKIATMKKGGKAKSAY